MKAFITNYIPITKIKIFLAKILYKVTTLFYSKKQLIKRNGINYEVDLSEGIDLSLFLFSSFQQHVNQNKFLKLSDTPIIFDVGANFGIMSLQFAKSFPKGKIYAFEPTHYALAKFKRNLELNPSLASRIELTNTFISDKTTQTAEIKAFSSWKLDGDKSSEKHPTHWGLSKSAQGVGSITIDDFCDLNNINKINFIKIDTDGHEYEVLKGGIKNISIQKPHIIFEIGRYVMKEKGIDFSFYYNYFNNLQYKLIDSKTGREITIQNYKSFIPAKGTIDILAIPT